MLVGWLLIELLLVIASVGMIFPRLSIRLRRRREPRRPISRRRRWIEAIIGLLLIGFVATDWSGLRLGWLDPKVPTTTSGTIAPSKAKLIDGIVKPALSSGQHIGLIVGVVDKGVTWTRGYGRSSASCNEPPDGDCVFDIGSVTKTFTCTALAALCAKDRVRLNDPVSKFFPDGVRMPAYKGKQITLVDLATQTSGLPRLPDNMGLMSDFSGDPYAKYSPDDSFRFLKKYKLTRAPGSTYEYSNFGMGLLGLALSRQTDVSYEQMVERLVCEPLDLDSTSITLSPSQKARLVQGYALQTKVGRLLLAVPADMWTMQDSFAGAGALRSTANDMLKYLQANIEPARTGLGPALAMTHEVRHKTDIDVIDIGLGWHTLNVPWSKEPLIWHDGGTGGYCSFVGFCPKRKLGVVVLSNTSGDVDVVALKIMKKLLLSDHAKH